MRVNFDGMRRNLARAYDKTVEGYHEAVAENGYDPSFSGLKEGLDEMRSMIAALLCCFDPDAIKKDNDFHDLSDEADALHFADPEDEDDEDD